ncbi:MAG: LysR substrate-binding domain-containing protein [Planctomycetota bacterium]
MTKLEETLDLRLVERRGHKLKLTPVGAAGKTGLALGMGHFSDAVQTMRRHKPAKRLIVSVEASLATTWLVPKLDLFWAKHPDIDLLVDASQHIVDLKQSDVDVAIRYGVPAEDGLITKRLFKDLVFPACSPSLAAGPPKLENLKQLRDVTLIHWDTNHLHWAQATQRWFSWSEWLDHAGVAGVDCSKGKRFTDYGLAVQAATAGQGVILAGWPALEETLGAGLLVSPFQNSVIETDIGFDVVTTAEASRRPGVATFVEWLTGVAGEVRWTG